MGSRENEDKLMGHDDTLLETPTEKGVCGEVSVNKESQT